MPKWISSKCFEKLLKKMANYVDAMSMAITEYIKLADKQGNSQPWETLKNRLNRALTAEHIFLKTQLRPIEKWDNHKPTDSERTQGRAP